MFPRFPVDLWMTIIFIIFWIYPNTRRHLNLSINLTTLFCWEKLWEKAKTCFDKNYLFPINTFFLFSYYVLFMHHETRTKESSVNETEVFINQRKSSLKNGKTVHFDARLGLKTLKKLPTFQNCFCLLGLSNFAMFFFSQGQIRH